MIEDYQLLLKETDSVERLRIRLNEIYEDNTIKVKKGIPSTVTIKDFLVFESTYIDAIRNNPNRMDNSALMNEPDKYYYMIASKVMSDWANYLCKHIHEADREEAGETLKTLFIKLVTAIEDVMGRPMELHEYAHVMIRRSSHQTPFFDFCPDYINTDHVISYILRELLDRGLSYNGMVISDVFTKLIKDNEDSLVLDSIDPHVIHMVKYSEHKLLHHSLTEGSAHFASMLIAVGVTGGNKHYNKSWENSLYLAYKRLISTDATFPLYKEALEIVIENLFDKYPNRISKIDELTFITQLSDEISWNYHPEDDDYNYRLTAFFHKALDFIDNKIYFTPSMTISKSEYLNDIVYLLLSKDYSLRERSSYVIESFMKMNSFQLDEMNSKLIMSRHNGNKDFAKIIKEILMMM